MASQEYLAASPPAPKGIRRLLWETLASVRLGRTIFMNAFSKSLADPGCVKTQKMVERGE
jgi:hypothetical protein